MKKCEETARHKELHEALDELVACWIKKSDGRLSQTTLLEFMEWSYEQTKEIEDESTTVPKSPTHPPRENGRTG